jgi:hypothetical protein
VKQKSGFSRPWRRDDEATLAAPDGSHDVNDAGGEAFGTGLEADAFGRVDCLEFVEMREFRSLLGRHIIHERDFGKLRAAGAILIGSM